MFQHIRWNDKETKYIIVDNDFEEDVEIIDYTYEFIYSIINAYEKRNLPALPNLIEYYKYGRLNIVNSTEIKDDYPYQTFCSLKLDLKYNEKIFPQLKFREKYYSCIANQLKRLQFSRAHEMV